VIYAIEDSQSSNEAGSKQGAVYVGQQLDVFIDGSQMQRK
jgi:hypothetical protein